MLTGVYPFLNFSRWKDRQAVEAPALFAFQEFFPVVTGVLMRCNIARFRHCMFFGALTTQLTFPARIFVAENSQLTDAGRIRCSAWFGAFLPLGQSKPA